MKNPNGYGTVRKLSGKRRRPFMVEVTTGWEVDLQTGRNKQIRETIGYCTTRKEGLQLLADYHTNPYDLSQKDITFGDIYNIWSESKYKKISERTVSCYKSAYKYCLAIADRPIQQLKTAELQHVIDECEQSSSTKDNIKVVMHGVFEYALQNDLVDKDYTAFIKIESTDPTYERIPYTKEEIDYLWRNSERFDIKILLILIYSGMRVNELLKMEHDCCNLNEKYLDIKKAKNKFSVRKVPIHDKIFELVKDFYNRNGENLIVNDEGFKISYNNFVARNLKRINKEMNAEHRFHDTRHTFITNAKKYGVDQLCLKKIVGHAPDNITERVYTHLEFSQLLDEINKIK